MYCDPVKQLDSFPFFRWMIKGSWELRGHLAVAHFEPSQSVLNHELGYVWEVIDHASYLVSNPRRVTARVVMGCKIVETCG